MKWGIVFSSTSCPDSEAAAALAESAEEAGFESLWAPEHIIIPSEYEPVYSASPTGRLDRLGRRGGVPDPIVWFAFVAARTTTMRFGTGVVILPEHNIPTFAKSCATLASLSKGRFMLGVGVGWNREEYEALGMPWDRRGERYEEAIKALRVLWREDEPSYEGVYLKFPPLACDPKPPGRTIPIVIGGTSAPAVRRAGRVGDGYFPAIFPTDRVYMELPKLVALLRSSAEESGRDPDSIEVTSGGVRTAEEARWFADVGVSRLTVAVRAKTIPEMREELLRFGDEVIATTVEL
jgi:probable F420-dependent oxidoreductase